MSHPKKSASPAAAQSELSPLVSAVSLLSRAQEMLALASDADFPRARELSLRIASLEETLAEMDQLLCRTERQAAQLANLYVATYQLHASLDPELAERSQVLLDALPATWKFEILATDISSKVLNKAVEAIYPVGRFHEIPSHFQRKFVLIGVGEREGSFRMAPEVRACVKFARVNLTAPGQPELGSFDFVFCRNVLIYFSAETRRRVVAWLCSHVKPGGHLWAGHSESLHELDPRLRTVVPTVYRVEHAQP